MGENKGKQAKGKKYKQKKRKLNRKSVQKKKKENGHIAIQTHTLTTF